MSDTLFGQCVCGASLTVEHLSSCPLQKQQLAHGEQSLREQWWVQFLQSRFDTSHVAVLGEN